MNLLLYLVAAALAAGTPAKAERRCGWLDNPSPANLWLVDRHGEWLITQQGGYRARGSDEMPDMSTLGQVTEGENHGSSCACMVVTTDRARSRITRVLSARPVPLRQCRSDRRLPRR